MTNTAARLVCSARKSDHITPLLRDLHWLRVPQRIKFKLAVLVFSRLNGLALPYFARELCRVADMDCRRRLRSASMLERHVPITCHVTVGDHTFSVSAALVWNGLTSSRRHRLQMTAEDTAFQPLVSSLAVCLLFLTCVTLWLVLDCSTVKCSWSFF